MNDDQKELFEDPVATEPKLVSFSAESLPDPRVKPPGWLYRLIQRTHYVRPLTIKHSGSGYGYIDGRRRAAVVKQLVADGELPKNFIVRGEIANIGGARAAALSVVLNEGRGQNVVGEYRAIGTLLQDGYSEKAVAAELGIPWPRFRKMMSLDGLLVGLLRALEQDKIAESTAYALAKLETDVQKRMLRQLEKTGKLTLKQVNEARRVHTEKVASDLPAELFEDDDGETVLAWPVLALVKLRELREIVPADTELHERVEALMAWLSREQGEGDE